MTQYCDMSKAPSHLRTAGAGGGKSAPRGAQRSGEGGSKKSSSWDDWQPSKSQMMVAYVLMFAVVAAVPRIIRGYVAHKHAPELREFDRLQALHAVQQRMMKANLRATLQAAQSNKPSAGTAAAAAASSPAAAAAKAAATSQPVAGQSPATTPPAQPAATGTAARPDRDKTE